MIVKRESTNDRYSTREVVVMFARQGVALDTIARALVTPVKQVGAACQRAIELGELERMPPQSPESRRESAFVELASLRTDLDEARALIRELRKAEAAEDSLVAVAKLTPSEARVVSTILKHGRTSKGRLYHALYGINPDAGAEPKIIDVLVCKARQKLAPHDIKINTIWGHGYEMAAEDAAKLRALASPVLALAPTLDDMVAA